VSAYDLSRAGALDAVLADAAQLRTRLGQSDRLRLDAHISAVRELQQRIERVPPAPPSEACMLPSQPADPTSERLRCKAMADVIAMAFACDLTRVATFQFSSPASHVAYPDIYPQGLLFNGSPTSFHEYEHNAGIDDTVRLGLRFFIENFAAFLESLRAIPEREGNLLDQCCILGTSDVARGPDHNFANFPLLVAGRAGGALVPGTHVALPGDNAARVPFTCLKAVGVPLDAWGQEAFYVDQPVSALLA
jgi:hypothetical protein